MFKNVGRRQMTDSNRAYPYYKLTTEPKAQLSYEGESISNKPFPLPIDRDGHDFYALFQYMFYTWVQNCTRHSLIRY